MVLKIQSPSGTEDYQSKHGTGFVYGITRSALLLVAFNLPWLPSQKMSAILQSMESVATLTPARKWFSNR